MQCPRKPIWSNTSDPVLLVECLMSRKQGLESSPGATSPLTHCSRHRTSRPGSNARESSPRAA
eukprot:scaffold317400_cov18-Tisochrysis_lutea.AAC.1